MPTPQSLGGHAQRTSAGRLKMLLVMLICAAPVIASYLTYYVIRPSSHKSYGELIDPQRPLPAVTGTTLQGDKVDLQTLKDQWLLVTVSSGACNATCEQNLYLQRQMRETLGREKDRLDRVWLIEDEQPVSPSLLPALKGAQVLRVPRETLAQWLPPASGKGIEEHMFIVDPMGNLMMRFPANMDASGASRAKRDIDRLLRASASWDQEGRP